MGFVFTRAPGTKTQVSIVSNSLTNAQNQLVIIGHQASTPGSAPNYVPYTVVNFADPIAVLAEMTTQFGASSEISTQVVAAINGVLQSNLTTVAFPPIVVIPLAHADVSSALNATLQGLLTLSAPFIASCYAGSDTVALTALLNYVTTISGDSRGRYGQFGSFCFMGLIGSIGSVTMIGTTTASQNMLFPWRQDSGGTPANSTQQLAAATAAVCAANGLPFMPMTDVIVGGLVPQVSMADWTTPDDTGTEVLALTAGLIPLMSNLNGTVSLSRTVTSVVRVAGTPDADYFDLQDWQVLYYLRQQCYVLAQQPQYKIAKASTKVAQALMSDIINTCKIMQDDLNMLQYVEQLVSQFVFARSATNRAAFTYQVPVNVIPGFYNKGISIIGTNQFDVLTA